MGAKISYRKNLTVTCQSNAPSLCYCKTGTGKNRGSTYSNVCCQTKVCSVAAISVQVLYAAPSHWVCTNSGHRQ
jgi:hypothetical protein